jgi:hypothetical protein
LRVVLLLWMSNKIARRLCFAAGRWGCGCPKAFERPRCTVEYSALSESWALDCRRLATTPHKRVAKLGSLRSQKRHRSRKRALEPYNASNQASPARPRRLHEPGAGSGAPEKSRRHAARARPRLVSNNALSQLDLAKPQGGTVVHAGSPCDAVSWAPCDRPHRQPRSDAAAQQDIACAATTGRDSARVGRVTTPAVK